MNTWVSSVQSSQVLGVINVSFGDPCGASYANNTVQLVLSPDYLSNAQSAAYVSNALSQLPGMKGECTTITNCHS